MMVEERIDKNKNKNDQKKYTNDHYVKFSFYITYAFLLTTAAITFIESIRTNNPTARHVLNLETTISLIAGYFYSTFLDKLKEYEKENKPINWTEITTTRYIDWSMTTPLMLLALSVTLSSNVKKVVSLYFILLVFLLNYSMLYIGYLGEIGQMDRLWACILGFIPFIIMFGIIYRTYVLPVYKLSNYVIFTLYVVIWSLYGVFYMMEKPVQNIGLNILDCLAKCIFGLGLWAYFTKVIVLRPFTIM
jgi:bacteriorhodopsin